MRRWFILSALGLLALLGTGGRAAAWWPGGPYYTSAAFPCVNPPGYYTNLYYYGWMYPWYSYYNYSQSSYYGWWTNGGFATYGGRCGPYGCGYGGQACPIPGYVGARQYYGPPFEPYCSPYSSHAGGPNGVWMRGPTPGTVSVTMPADATLRFNGAVAEGGGGVRTYQTPPLQPGQDYTYELTAEVRENGRVRQVTERVTVRAGEETKVVLAVK